MESLLAYTAAIIGILVWLRWRWMKTCVFRQLGIPGPKPNFFFGNFLELYGKGPLECEKEWIEKYGDVVGYYYGMRPILLVADPELLKKIFIKYFNSFTDRPEAVPMRFKGMLDYILPTRSLFDSLLVNIKGERWKEVRKILTPTFSSNKMKLMIPVMNEAIDATVSKIEEKTKTGETFEIYDIFRRLTLDIICQTAFAVKMNIQQDPDNAFFLSAKLMFETEYKSLLMLIGASFPEIDSFVMVINFVYAIFKNKGVIPPLKVTWMIGDVIKERRKHNQGYVDLLQLMIDASASKHDDFQNGFVSETTADSPDTGSALSHKKNLRLTDKEVQANALLIFLAGFETTSTVLAYVFHLLTKYPHFQDQIREEIDDMLMNEDELNYSSVAKLKLLDRFFLESMRLYPPVTKFNNRIAIHDVKYDELSIPEGMQIQLPVYYMHHNPKYFPDPEVFDPDRFLPENKNDNFSVTYVPFGVGPRNCLGIRFATMETKLAIAKLLQRFIFSAVGENSEIDIEMKLSTRVPAKVLVKARERCIPAEIKI